MGENQFTHTNNMVCTIKQKTRKKLFIWRTIRQSQSPKDVFSSFGCIENLSITNTRDLLTNY